MIEEILENIFRVRVPLFGPLKELNAYLIRGPKSRDAADGARQGRHLLIDSGFNTPEGLAVLKEAAEQAGISFDDTDFFVTHLHADHCGLVPDLRTNPDSFVYASAHDAAYINGMAGGLNQHWHDHLYSALPLGVTTEQIHQMEALHPAITNGPSATLPFTIVNDGDTLSYGGYNLRVIEAPGHTPGLLCLYEPSRRILFSSDHILGDITPNITNWDGHDSLAEYLESLDKTERLDLTMALPGHRSLILDPVSRIKALRKHHDDRLAEVRRILAEHGPITAYQTASMMTWSIRYRNWDDFPMQQKWFACHEAASHLIYLLGKHLTSVSKDKDGVLLFALSK